MTDWNLKISPCHLMNYTINRLENQSNESKKVKESDILILIDTPHKLTLSRCYQKVEDAISLNIILNMVFSLCLRSILFRVT